MWLPKDMIPFPIQVRAGSPEAWRPWPLGVRSVRMLAAAAAGLSARDMSPARMVRCARRHARWQEPIRVPRVPW